MGAIEVVRGLAGPRGGLSTGSAAGARGRGDPACGGLPVGCGSSGRMGRVGGVTKRGGAERRRLARRTLSLNAEARRGGGCAENRFAFGAIGRASWRGR